MASYEQVTFNRDCTAVAIPSGDPITIKSGEIAFITQSLGGNYTLMLNGNLVQIDGKDADAIDQKTVANHAVDDPCEAQQAPDEYAVRTRLKTCYDPEIPVNIVDLGLIYDLNIQPIDDCFYRVDIKMTLTAPGCGMGDYIAADVKKKALLVPGITEANIELVWEPLWNREMMSDAARLELGLF
ncbi:MAG: putative Fe-S cluster assembly protein SufT [Candidatus Marinimicrobia bacterium]|nr:putative Fe-S cluster assembly protein SufT [Candidatus Neomarinimicrobiota bacterium]